MFKNNKDTEKKIKEYADLLDNSLISIKEKKEKIKELESKIAKYEAQEKASVVSAPAGVDNDKDIDKIADLVRKELE